MRPAPISIRLAPDVEKKLNVLVSKTGLTRNAVFSKLVENADVRTVEEVIKRKEIFFNVDGQPPAEPAPSGQTMPVPMPVDNGKLKTTGKGFKEKNFSSQPATSGKSDKGKKKKVKANTMQQYNDERRKREADKSGK